MSMTKSIRRLPVLTLTLAAALACAALSAGTAQAATSVSCSTDETGVFSPALNNSLQTVTYDLDQALTCTSSTHPSITSGVVSSNDVYPLQTCGSLTIGGLRVRTITWNTGETSVITFVAVATTGPGNVITIARTGAITAGKFFGALTSENFTMSVDRSVCSTTGVPGYHGTSELTINSLL